jgi:hypothetical protein
MEKHPGLMENQTRTSTISTIRTTHPKPTSNTIRSTTGDKTMTKTNHTPTAAETTEKELDAAKARHAATEQTLEEAVTHAAALNARLDDGDEAVSLDDTEQAERAVVHWSRLAEGQAKKVAEAEANHRLASADLRMAERLASPLARLPHAWQGTDGTLYKSTPTNYSPVPWSALTEQRPTDAEERSIYLSQDAPTQRDARTGIESGTVIVAVPAGMHLPTHGDRWISAAGSVGLLIGERGTYGTRSVPNSRVKQISAADGSEYDLHRVAVERARPSIPVITATELGTDAEAWASLLVEQIEHKATVETRYGSLTPFVRDLRITLRDFTTSDDANGNRVTRRIHVTGLATINPSDNFDDLSRHIVRPVVEEWLTSDGYTHGIAAGLGRAASLVVKFETVGRGQANVTIDASFVSTTE